MPPAPSARPSGRFTTFIAALAVLAALCSGCVSAGGASFDPTSPCSTDGKMAGAYPDLEAQVPTTVGGSARTSLDSGRNCSSQNLGSLAGHGVTELRFAGGIWTDAAQSGLTLVVFRATGLQADWIGEWYELPARAARTTGGITTTRPIVSGRQGNRMDLVNGESRQSVITWPAAGADTIFVVLAADEDEARIQQAIAAFP